MPTDYHQAKAAREAAEALLALVSPGLRWAALKPALDYVAELRAQETQAFTGCLAALNGSFEVAYIATAA